MAELRYPRPGAAGASAQAVYEARRFSELSRYHGELQRDAAWRTRVRTSHPLVGRVMVAGRRPPPPPFDPATDAWAVGAEGERAVAAVLERCGGMAVLHDRARPGSWANLDHVVVGRAGVYVIETKAYNTEIALFRHRWWGRTALLVAGRDRDDLLASVRDQARAVERVLSDADATLNGTSVWPVLCFVGGDWRIPTVSSSVEGVEVTCLDGLARLMRSRGRLSSAEIADWRWVLDRALPPR